MILYHQTIMKSSILSLLPSTKSLPPLPVHPHCLCRYVEIIEGEVDMQEQRDQVREAGDKWLNNLPESRKVVVAKLIGVPVEDILEIQSTDFKNLVLPVANFLLG